MQRPQVEVGRLANAVHKFTEGQNSHKHTSDAGFEFEADADILKVQYAWKTFRLLSRAGADDNGLSLVWVHWQMVTVEQCCMAL